MKRLSFPLLAALWLSSLAARAELRPMTTDDGLDLIQVGDVELSPDGSRVFFSKSELDWGRNKRKKTFWMAPAEGGETYPFIGEAGGEDFAFSPDGRHLAFKREVEKKAQIFVMRTAGGEARQLTKHDTAVKAFQWTPDSARIFFVAADFAGKEAEKKKKKGEDAIFVEEGPNGQSEDAWSNLWSVDLASKEEKALTRETFRVGGFDISPDGSRVVLTARRENRRNQQYLSELYLLEADSGGLEKVTENQAPEGSPRWAPDGSAFAFMAAGDRNWELREDKIWMRRLDDSGAIPVSSAFEGDISRYVWTPDSRSILFVGQQRTDTNVYRLNLADGSVEPLTRETGTLNQVSFSADRGKMAFLRSDFRTPPDLFVSPVESFEPVRITDANPWVAEQLLLAKAEVIRWKSADGLEIEGILHLPADAEPGKPLPLILHVHGGPAGSFANDFRSAYHVWAGLGYASLSPNVRGSSGYGDALLRGNMKDIGGGDYHDLMTGVDHVVALGWADPDRLGIRGWSYGGILGGWTITRTNRFKAASLGAMVSDWTSEYGPGFNHDVRLWYIGGTPWENPREYREKSALTHVAQVQTPTLILHGMRDTTDTEPQSMMFYAALKDQGKPVRYIRFPREPHGFREPRHIRTRDVEEIRWMQKHVLGLEWEPWKRPEKESEEGDQEEKADEEPAVVS